MNITKLEFAWSTLTEQQQYRINVKYDLVKSLKNRGNNTKRSVYISIANRYGYTMRCIENIANNLNK